MFFWNKKDPEPETIFIRPEMLSTFCARGVGESMAGMLIRSSGDDGKDYETFVVYSVESSPQDAMQEYADFLERQLIRLRKEIVSWDQP